MRFWRFSAAILLIIAGLAQCRSGPERPNFVFITIDTLRADHTPFGGYARKTMPATEAFFQEGVRFLRAQTVRTQTTPAYASMMTGLYPYRHGVRTLFTKLHSDNITMAEMLRDQGYETAAFVSSFVMI